MVMCENLDQGIKWPQLHTLLLEESGGGHERDLPTVRKKDASEASQDGLLKDMGSKRTSVRSCKRECGQSQAQATLRRKTNENVDGQAPTRDEKCTGCTKEDSTEKHRLYHCPSWKRETRSRKGWGSGSKGPPLQRRLEVAERNCVALTEQRQLEEEPLGRPKVGSLKNPKGLEHASRRISTPGHHRWLFVGSPRQVGRVRMISGRA